MRVLVIEDEKDLSSVIRRMLEEEGFVCDVANDGESGLFNARSWEYDAIILDLMLPGVDGWTILRELRKEKKTPVLILTARDALPDRVRGLDQGADDYLTKPFDLEELLARVRSLIRRSSGHPDSRICLGKVEIDTVSRTVRKGGKEVELTPKEFALLEFLAFRRGALVSRSMIYDHLYNEEDGTLSNVLDVYVSNLRRKLGREFIRTRRGEGYLLP